MKKASASQPTRLAAAAAATAATSTPQLGPLAAGDAMSGKDADRVQQFKSYVEALNKQAGYGGGRTVSSLACGWRLSRVQQAVAPPSTSLPAPT